ncbi:hypothetical protein CAEBREN_23295 [Caenorhabditis brenneri]|uniref:Uncharacterized protein n=1 Tax=Caenorhabditis brenneri TaxID=135651 RepID=G0MH42_CAEBE|nr:hypothetical protein CAEBREN_23295 [Caenorhabditis brenneri]
MHFQARPNGKAIHGLFQKFIPSADSPLHNSRDERPIAQRDLERLFQQLNLLEDRLSMSSRRLNQSSTREIQESMRGEVSRLLPRRPTNIKLQVLEFFSGGRRYARWWVAKVNYGASYSIGAFEQRDQYLIRAPERFHRDNEPEDSSDDAFRHWNNEIINRVKSREAIVLTSAVKWSERRFIKAAPRNCGCPNDEDEPLEFNHDDGTLCAINQIVDKGLIVLHHELQSREFHRLFSIKTDFH